MSGWIVCQIAKRRSMFAWWSMKIGSKAEYSFCWGCQWGWNARGGEEEGVANICHVASAPD